MLVGERMEIIQFLTSLTCVSLSHTAEAVLKPYLFLFFSPLTLSQSPPKGVTIPYRPKPSSSPVIFAGGQVRKFLLLG